MKHKIKKEEIASLVETCLTAKYGSKSLKSYYVLLSKTLQALDYYYYVLDKPKIDDQTYDTLFKQLLTIEEQHPELKSPNSPSQRVGSNLVGNFISEQHLSPMLSLENSYNKSNITEWLTKILSAYPKDNITFSAEPKFDGAGISLIYEKDQLTRALTRGDGKKGDVVTQNAKQIYSIPLSAKFSDYGIRKIEIRGEVMMSKSKFENINKTLKAENKPLLINPRNAASGSLRIKNTKLVKERKLEAFLYHVSSLDFSSTDPPFTTHKDIIHMLHNLGFQTTLPYLSICQNIEDVISAYTSMKERRKKSDYEMDGMVVKVNDLHLQEKLGITSHHPKWAVAFKFKAKQGTSKIKAVHFQVGRTGIISPVAKIFPVSVGGATISSVSLFNEKNIIEKDLKISDTILVERSGDVIPYIVKSYPDKRTGNETQIYFPKVCPSCETKLIKQDLEAWVCPNKTGCEEQMIGSILHFSSKDAMDIRTLGEANIRRFFQLGFLKNIPDIFDLPFEKIKTLDGFSEKSTINLKQAIENAKTRSSEKLLYGLGIPHVGEIMAQTLCKRYKNIFNLMLLNEEKLQHIEDVGEVVANSLTSFFSNQKNIKTLEWLQQAGVNMKYKSNLELSENAFLEGKSFLFTGTLSKRKRREAEKLVESFGGTIASGVNKKLSYLIVGDNAGSKLEKAKKIKTITIFSEEQLEQVLSQQTLNT